VKVKGLEGKVVMVTGGASGIGRATAERLVDEGAKVALVDIDRDKAVEVAEGIGGETLGVGGDVSSEGDVERYFAEVDEHFGRIDGLHNNAGIEGPTVPIADLEAADLERLLAVNFLGIFLNLRQMLRVSRDSGTAVNIVNTSSLTALAGAPFLGAYAATKSAVISLTRTAALECAETGTRVNAVVPGPTDTPMFDRVDPEYRAMVEDLMPVGRFARPEEVAAMVTFLLSDEAPFATGGLYPVDGGGSAK
jgi:NAD(P)-dependent dehydrogenase (short-subunit alcohol dehydrogenase family)